MKKQLLLCLIIISLITSCSKNKSGNLVGKNRHMTHVDSQVAKSKPDTWRNHTTIKGKRAYVVTYWVDEDILDILNDFEKENGAIKSWVVKSTGEYNTRVVGIWIEFEPKKQVTDNIGSEQAGYK